MPETMRTPGNWKIRRSNDGSGDVGIWVDGLPNILAECFGAIRRPGERAADEAMANACLIAAAPEMLEALKLAEELYQTGSAPNELIERVAETRRAAIAKAEGPKAPKFTETFCSSCGRNFGPGDHGFSHCSDHAGTTFDSQATEEGGAMHP